jgi:hypothetical protein
MHARLLRRSQPVCYCTSINASRQQSGGRGSMEYKTLRTSSE